MPRDDAARPSAAMPGKPSEPAYGLGMFVELPSGQVGRIVGREPDKRYTAQIWWVVRLGPGVYKMCLDGELKARS